ncbi:hypothetical protein DNTS_011970 [Danionella cerebrum]|uniref:Uncharacterized protein n=1 Tax=Danionella cerebrum TaxID=2873325 RepID=A0A553RHM1_9TELE|nr:hypothetical protein DNTS_011970 [Danionella translucida]
MPHEPFAVQFLPAPSPTLPSSSSSPLHPPKTHTHQLARSLSRSLTRPWLKKPCSPPPPPLAGLHGAALHGKRGNEEETKEVATLVRDSLILPCFDFSFCCSFSLLFPPSVHLYEQCCTRSLPAVVFLFFLVKTSETFRSSSSFHIPGEGWAECGEQETQTKRREMKAQSSKTHQHEY